MFDGKMSVFREEGGVVKTEEEKRPKIIKHSYSIKKEDLIGFMAKFKGIEEKIERMKIESRDDTFEISAEIQDDEPLK